MKYPKKEHYDIADLLEIMRILRQPEGCPWDREQTHQSICKNMLEEAYEAVDAIRRNDLPGMQEELGDVLMQVVFHAQIETEQGGFRFDDVTDGVCKKLIYRHPHVFGSVTADTSEQVLKNWDMLKKVEKSQKTQTEAMQAVPDNLPALMRNEKLQQKAERGGLLPESADACRAKLCRLAKETPQSAEKQVGQLLETVVALARACGVDPEEALTARSDRFISAFGELDAKCRSEGVPLREQSAEMQQEFRQNFDKL